MKKDFIDEGNIDLWEYRFRESNRYANWGENKYSRYLYEIEMKNVGHGCIPINHESFNVGN